MFSKHISGTRQSKITELLVNVITENALPLHFSEKQSVRDLLHYLEPNYKVPCCETIQNCVKDEAKKTRSAISEMLSKTAYIALTTDAWTAMNNKSYLALTSSFMWKWEIRTAVLETINLEDRHTSEYLAQKIEKALLEWSIQEKVTAIVHDNGSNVAKIATTINDNYCDIPCAAHTLQLCVNSAMGTSTQVSQHVIARTINAASRLVGHFNHSPLATSEMMKRQTNMLMQQPFRTADEGKQYNNRLY